MEGPDQEKSLHMTIIPGNMRQKWSISQYSCRRGALYYAPSGV